MLTVNKTNRIQRIQKLSQEQLDPELVRQLPLEFLKTQHAIPVLLDGQEIAVALADPMNIEAYDAVVTLLSAIEVKTDYPWVLGQPCKRLICAEEQIENAISHCYYHVNPMDAAGTTQLSENEDHALENELAHTGAEDLLNIADKSPAIKLVNNILFQAVQSRASDIHIEPYETETRIRYRVDGVLHDVLTVENSQVRALQSRLKIMANLNIAEQRLPQDGQSRIKIGPDLVDIRVSVIPTLGGERIVLRILDKGRGQLALEDIGFDPEAQSLFRSLVQRPHGIVLLTGPTGSGKTTTLYSALNELNSQERNILTVEDPVEYQLPGIGQMQVKPKIGLTFASCLRHILRQDPDVIMVGEIRDLETAQIAIQASLTGHLVFSTLHTNDSASAITRLVDMGIEPYLISSSVIAVIAQRLLRVICTHCKEVDTAFQPSFDLMHSTQKSPLPDGQLYKGRGCENCLDTGYFGRTAISEQLVIDDSIRDLINQRCGSHRIHDQAIQSGLVTLRDDGLRKALSGRSTLEEVLRVTQDQSTMDQGVG
jgi:general secretion pathway protein E